MDVELLTEPQFGATYDQLEAMARLAENCGFHGFFRSDHLLAMDGIGGAPGPTDAWVTLAALGRATSRIRLGTLVSSATFRWPGVLAVAVAQADQMSGGRIELGLGAGWYQAEHTARGIPFPELGQRMDMLAEQLEILRRLWRTVPDETFTHHGQFYSLDNTPNLPCPIQQPGPPVIVGGTGPRRTPMIAAHYADEFNVTFGSLDLVADRVRRLDQACAAVRRDPSTIRRSVGQLVRCGRSASEIQRRAGVGVGAETIWNNRLEGSPSQIVNQIGTWRERTGIERVYLEILDLGDFEHIELIGSDVIPQL